LFRKTELSERHAGHTEPGNLEDIAFFVADEKERKFVNIEHLGIKYRH
jgi:hypothetical protein